MAGLPPLRILLVPTRLFESFLIRAESLALSTIPQNASACEKIGLNQMKMESVCNIPNMEDAVTHMYTW